MLYIIQISLIQFSVISTLKTVKLNRQKILAIQDRYIKNKYNNKLENKLVKAFCNIHLQYYIEINAKFYEKI